MPVILETENLVKKYGDHVAVNEISFTMEEGEVFGLLGPNGAGKSTTISMLTCLFPPTSGSIHIYGHDVMKEAKAVKRLIGIVPQDLALYPTLNARDNLVFYGRMFGLGGADLKQRVENVLQMVAMTDRANDPVKTYSGGMKRRINLAVGLIHSPRILFLDEPTVGVGLSTTSNEDVNGVWVDAAGKIYLTMLGSFSVTDVSGDGSDIITCTPGSLGSTTTCTWAMYWDGSLNDFSSEDTDSLAILP